MSLINKMLQDLEARQHPPSEPNQKKVYEDLKPISRISRPRRTPRLLIMLSLVLLVGAGAYAWMQWGDWLRFGDVAPVSAPPVARTPPPKPVPPVAAPKPSDPAPAAAPTPPPVTVATATAVPPTVESPTAVKPVEPAVTAAPVPSSNPPTVVTAKPVPATPAISSKPKKAEHSKAAAAKANGYWTVARGETLYGISVQTGIELSRLSRWNNLERNNVIHIGQRLRLTPPEGKPAAVSAKVAAPAVPSGTQAKQPPVLAERPAAKTEARAPTEATTAGNSGIDRKFKAFSSNEKAESEYRRAVDLLYKGSKSDAERHLKLALQSDAAHTAARELLAGLMLQQGHWREAEGLLEQGVQQVPNHAPFALLLARVYVEHGSEPKALGVLEKSRPAGAQNPEYLAFLAALYQRSGKHTDAVKAYHEVVVLSPQEGRWWLGLGISLEALQDWNAAGAAYRRALDSGTLDEKLFDYARQRHAVVKNK